jgi:hypothetical protein
LSQRLRISKKPWSTPKESHSKWRHVDGSSLKISHAQITRFIARNPTLYRAVKEHFAKQKHIEREDRELIELCCIYSAIFAGKKNGAPSGVAYSGADGKRRFLSLEKTPKGWRLVDKKL